MPMLLELVGKAFYGVCFAETYSLEVFQLPLRLGCVLV